MSAATDYQVAEIWAVARQRYEAICDKKLKDADLSAVTSLDDLERAVDKESRDFRAFRERRATIFKVMRDALIPVELAGKYLGGMEGGVFPASSVVFAAVKQLITAAHEVSSKLDAIQDVMGQLQFFTTRLGVYNKEVISTELRAHLAEVLATLLQILALTTKAIERGRIRAFGRNLLRGEDKDIQDAVKKLDKLTSDVDSLVGAETSVLVQRQGRAVEALTSVASSTYDEIHQSRADNRDMHDEVIAAIKNSQRPRLEDKQALNKKVHALLQPSTRAQDTYVGISKGHLSGTGQWIQTEGAFQAWLGESNPVLWISGAPGAGKSYLSASIISYLQDKIVADADNSAQTVVGYFFFKDDEPKTRSFSKALRDIAYQIAQSDVSYSKHLLATCEIPEDIESIESAWQKLILDYFSSSQDDETHVYLILDGLDEAYDSDRSTFLPLLKDITSATPHTTRIRVAMAGRPHLSDIIADALENEAIPTISVDESKNAGDIANYIQNGRPLGIRSSRKLRAVSKQLQEEIFETLTSKSNGMFLWTDLMLKELNAKRNESEIRNAMQNAPRGLTQMLHHVLVGLSEFSSDEDAEDLNRILTIVTFAKRRLTLAELDGFLRYSYGTGEGILLLERKLRKDWASFLVLVRNDGRTTTELETVDTGLQDVLEGTASHSDDDDAKDLDLDADFHSDPDTTEVAFCHASIGDYFRNPNNGKVRSAEGPSIGVDSITDGSYVLKIILAVITDSDWEDKLGGETQFLTYAISHWVDYLRDTNKIDVTVQDKVEIGSLILKLCRDEDTLDKFAFFNNRVFWIGDALMVVRSWLEDPQLFEGQSEVDRAWIKATADRPVETFKAMALLNTKRWLASFLFDSTQLFWCTLTYLQLLQGKEISDPLQGVSDPQVIINTAEWANLEKTANWHRRVAMVLRDAKFLEDAIAYFKHALKLDPNMWIARSGLSRLYQGQGYTQAALDMTLEVVAFCRLNAKPDSKDCDIGDLADALDEAGLYYSMLGKELEAYQFRREAWETHPVRGSRSFDKCMEFLYNQERFEDLMNLFEASRTKQDIDEPDRMMMTPWILEKCSSGWHPLFASLYRAARITNRMEAVVDGMREACFQTQPSQHSLHELATLVVLANIYYAERIDEERALRIWKYVASVGDASKLEMSIGIVKERAIRSICNYYSTRAEETEGTDASSDYVRLLEDLGTAGVRSGERIAPGWASLILGQWYHRHGPANKAQAHFKANMKYGLQILTDDDPNNDLWGWMYLSQTLIFAGDEENIVALLRMLFARREEDASVWQVNQNEVGDELQTDIGLNFHEQSGSREHNLSTTAPSSFETKETTVVNRAQHEPMLNDTKPEASSGPSSDKETTELCPLPCEGVCKYVAGQSPWSMIWWICRDCAEGLFCSECLALLKADKLPIKRCSARHKFMRFTHAAKHIPPGKILIGDDRLEDLEEWKKQLKKEWGV